MSGTDQYADAGVARYEWIFGQDLLSSGALEIARRAADYFALEPGARVLDIGCGLGGVSFYFARGFGAEVLGVDVLEKMVRESARRAREHGLDRCAFRCVNIVEQPLNEGVFDCAYSKDAFLHVEDKPALFRAIRGALVRRGRLYFADYMRGENVRCEEFETYARESQYSLETPRSYQAVVRDAGFDGVEFIDLTERLRAILEDDLDRIAHAQASELSADDKTYLEARWRLKLRCIAAGAMKWGALSARAA